MSSSINTAPYRHAILAALVTLCLANWLVGCGPVRVEAEGSSGRVDWSVGLPF